MVVKAEEMKHTSGSDDRIVILLQFVGVEGRHCKPEGTST